MIWRRDFDTSQAWCSAVMRANAKSFYFSTRLLPRAKREAVEALYALFRTVDDFADEPEYSDRQRLLGIEAIERDLEHLDDPEYLTDAPWFAAVRRAFESFPIDLAAAQRLIAGCKRDLEPVEIVSMDELERYSAAVAGTVGLCSMPILGAGDPDSLARGERLGIAMQLTNILRDVDEDRRLGRNYLPMQAFPGHSVPEVMHAIAGVARRYYSESRVLASRVPNDGSRAALLVTSDIYGGILDHLERRNFDPSLGRAYVGTGEKLRRALRCVVVAYTGFATIK
jgi:phytoene synthase